MQHSVLCSDGREPSPNGAVLPSEKELESDITPCEVKRAQSMARRSKRINERHTMGSTDLRALPIFCS